LSQTPKPFRHKQARAVLEDGTSLEIDGKTKTVVAELKGRSKSSPKEHTINKKACDLLNSIEGCHAHKVVGTVYSTTGQPDIIACFRGQMFALEGKVRNKLVTPIGNVRPNQRAALKEWCAAGARVGIYTTPEEAVSMLTAWGDSGSHEDFWLWYGNEGNAIWKHVDDIPTRD
jgi:hypothetical protein